MGVTAPVLQAEDSAAAAADVGYVIRVGGAPPAARVPRAAGGGPEDGGEPGPREVLVTSLEQKFFVTHGD